MTRLRHYDDWGTARFVTFSCFDKRPYLTSAAAKRLFVKNLDLVRKKYGFRLLGYVIMPEHVHLVLFPPDGMKMGLMIRELRSRTAVEYFRSIARDTPSRERVFWFIRCHDHNCRSEKSTLEKITYCHKNPVRRGLVRDPGQYEWSSYHWYEGRRDVPIAMDAVES